MFVSPWKDALIVLAIVLLFFGPKRLPALSRSIGESIKEFKGGIAEATDSDQKPEMKSEISSTGSEPQSTSPASEHTNA
jgi:sec-independent protein translocase protein TatA